MPGRVGRSAASVGDGRRRRPAAPVVRYADETYDALHQWEDGDVAAMHERLRREAAAADDMFDREGRRRGRGGGTGQIEGQAPRESRQAIGRVDTETTTGDDDARFEANL